MAGKAIVTLSRSSVEPFLKSWPTRPARKGLQGLHRPRRQWQRQRQQRHHRGDPPLREEAAKIMGFPTYAAYRLEDSMAKTPEAVRSLLERVRKPDAPGYLPTATRCRR